MRETAKLSRCRSGRREGIVTAASAYIEVKSTSTKMCHTTPAFLTGLHMTQLTPPTRSQTAPPKKRHDCCSHASHEFHAVPAVPHNARIHHRAAHDASWEKRARGGTCKLHCSLHTHTHEFHAIPAVPHNARFHHRAAHGVTGKKESSRQHQTPE
jgi:hypothetical protein